MLSDRYDRRGAQRSPSDRPDDAGKGRLEERQPRDGRPLRAPTSQHRNENHVLTTQPDRSHHGKPEQQDCSRAAQQVEASTREVSALVGGGELLVRWVGADPQALRRDDVQSLCGQPHVGRNAEGENPLHIKGDDPAVRPREQLQRVEQCQLVGVGAKQQGDPSGVERSTHHERIRAPGLADDDDPDLRGGLGHRRNVGVADQHDLTSRRGARAGHPAGLEAHRGREVVRAREEEGRSRAGQLAEDDFLADRVRRDAAELLGDDGVQADGRSPVVDRAVVGHEDAAAARVEVVHGPAQGVGRDHRSGARGDDREGQGEGDADREERPSPWPVPQLGAGQRGDHSHAAPPPVRCGLTASCLCTVSVGRHGPQRQE